MRVPRCMLAAMICCGLQKDALAQETLPASDLRALWEQVEVAGQMQFGNYYPPPGMYSPSGLPRAPQQAVSGNTVISPLLVLAQSPGK